MLMRRAWDNSHATNSTAFALDLQRRAVPRGVLQKRSGAIRFC
jgi:hypothetical protein